MLALLLAALLALQGAECVENDVVTHTPSTVALPKSMNMMLADDVDHVPFRPTPIPDVATPKADEHKAPRALNLTVDVKHDKDQSNSSTGSKMDLSDVTIGDEDEDAAEDGAEKVVGLKNVTGVVMNVCEKGGLTYEHGEKLENGCDNVCTCLNGKMECEERCKKPFFRKGKKIEDSLCSEKESDDPCCSVMVCAGDTETEPLEICSYDNKVYNRGETFNKGCSEVCTCEAGGKIACKARCPPQTKTSDRCVEIPDPKDPKCCKKVLCDVTLDENESETKEEERPQKRRKTILSADYVNDTTIVIKFETNAKLEFVELGRDEKHWEKFKVLPGGYVRVPKEGEKVKWARVENSTVDEAVKVREMTTKQGCEYKGKTFAFREEYNDNCTSLCSCQTDGKMKCLPINCPTYFGLDVLNPSCVRWETVPPDFKPTPPDCCPNDVKCVDDGSCRYGGRTFKNWDQIPLEVSGCEKRCYCEIGKVECQTVCPPVPALPPPGLGCDSSRAVLGTIDGDECCKIWTCKEDDFYNTEKPRISTSTTENYSGPFAPRAPSKVLGPLAVYENEMKTKIDPRENPYYHKEGSIEDPKGNTKEMPQRVTKDPLGDPRHHKEGPRGKDPSNPLENPYYHKEGYQKVPKDPTTNSLGGGKKKGSSTLFVTPPPSKDQKPPGLHDEVLQFINRHPEISSYPSGTVVEIHDGKPKVQNVPIPTVPGSKVPPFEAANVPNPNLAFPNVPFEAGKFPFNQPPLLNNAPGQPKIHLVPYLAVDGHNDLPPGFSLEQILQEFHKNSQPYVGGVRHPLFQQSGIVIPDRVNGSLAGSMLPGSFPGFTQPDDSVSVHTLEAIDPHTVRLAFMVPRVIVGLHGRVEVRYTHTKSDNELDSWMLQIFAPPDDLIATPSLEFDLLDLLPDTDYKIKITITLRDVDTTHTSRIYHIRTPKEPRQTTTLPPLIPIEPELGISDINSTWVVVSWRKFTEYETQFIDGVQLRYKEVDGKIYQATPLIHRAVTTYTLEGLKPNAKYELGIFFVPFNGQNTELHSKNMLHFTTANQLDTYGFNVTLEIAQIKPQNIEISWSGVPYPEDKYVNIYRAIYQSDSGKEDRSTFKMAKRDSPTRTVIGDLKPGTRYRIWLEVYLTNGKVKTSNVQDFVTKPRPAPSLATASQQDKLSRAAQMLEPKGDYYGPLVIVAILAAIAILSTLILLLILVRRHNQNKAAITSPASPTTRVSQSAYDNPTYKVEIQQETMGL